jgi:hypothetical protein
MYISVCPLSSYFEIEVLKSHKCCIGDATWTARK